MRTPARLLFVLVVLSASSLTAQTVTWVNAANGQVVADCDPANNPGGEFFWPDNNNWDQDQLLGSNPCTGMGTTFERQPSNWSTPSYPDSTIVDVVLDGNSPTILNVSVDVGTLTVGASNTLQINGARTLDVFGGSIVNDGLIDIKDESTDLAILRINGNTNLTGSGTILFNSDDDNRIQSALPAHVLTIGADQTLLAPAIAVGGSSNSRITAACTNNGTITVDEGGLWIDTNPKTNNNIIQSINGGDLSFVNTTVENALGTITADTGSTVTLDNSAISGGQLLGPGIFGVTDDDATLNGPLTIDDNATLTLDTSDILFLTGTVTNNALIELDDNGTSSARLRISGDVTLDGTGQVLFKSNDDCIIDSVDPADILTIAPDQLLVTSADAVAGSSQSRLIARTINNGTITADIGGLRIDTYDKTNNNVIQSLNGGEIEFVNTAVDNTNGTITAGAGSTVTLSNATITGGQLLGPGNFNVATADATVNGPVTIDGTATVAIGSNDILFLTGTVTNNALIELRDTTTGTAFLRIDGDVTLAGTGEVRFEGTEQNSINSVDPADILTIGPDQHVVTAADTNAGDSRILARVVNNGTITADAGGLRLDTNDKTNNSLIRTLNGGFLEFQGMTVDNSNGIIDLDAGGTLLLDAATLAGGSLTGNGMVAITTADATFDGIGLTIGSGITIETGTNDVLFLKGTITNDGTIRITDNTSGLAYLRIDGDVTLDGSGEIVFFGNDDDVLDSVADTDVLTIGANQTLTTSAVTNAGTSGTSFDAAALNLGVVEARVGDLRLENNPKTNNGIFRAVNGGILRVASADTLLTNYDHASGTLTGGCYEVIANGATTLMDLPGATITTLAPGTKIVLSGTMASFPAIATLTSSQGTLAVRNQQVLATTGNLAVAGRLEFGLTDGATDGFNATRLDVDGDVDFSGAFVDVSDFGVTVGSYEVVTWTGTRTGTLPGVGNLPLGFGATVNEVGSSLFLNVVTVPVPPPVLLDVDYDPFTNTATLTYESIDGEAFGVLGGQDLSALAPLPDTVVGDGSVKQYTHNPPGSPEEYYYQLTRG